MVDRQTEQQAKDLVEGQTIRKRSRTGYPSKTGLSQYDLDNGDAWIDLDIEVLDGDIWEPIRKSWIHFKEGKAGMIDFRMGRIGRSL
jgi:hypothetical protein